MVGFFAAIQLMVVAVASSRVSAPVRSKRQAGKFHCHTAHSGFANFGGLFAGIDGLERDDGWRNDWLHANTPMSAMPHVFSPVFNSLPSEWLRRKRCSHRSLFSQKMTSGGEYWRTGWITTTHGQSPQ